MRYTLHYLNQKGESWQDDYRFRWESMDFKTLKEAKEYKYIAGDEAYIIDNVTGKRID